MKTPAHERIAIPIGKSSDGIAEDVDLSTMPHLFLSYSEEDQLYHYLGHLLHSWNQTSEITYQIATALSLESFNVLEKHFNRTKPFYSWIRNNPEMGTIGSKSAFIQAIFKELKKRQKKTESTVNINQKFQSLIVIIDDLLEMLVNKRKNTGLRFLQLMIEGPAVRIHFITASGRSFRNLLNQLINMNPVTKEQLQQQLPNINLTYHLPLGAELILTPENLFFFKARNESDFQRFYAIETTTANPY